MVSTMERSSTGVCVRLQHSPLSSDDALQLVDSGDCGAQFLFRGTVRNHHRDRQVDRLEYHGYEGMAVRELEIIASRVIDRWPVEKIVIFHRLGMLEIGETALVIALSSPHRKEGFEALRHSIDSIKETVPIWKREHYLNGVSEWIEGS